MRQVSPSEIAGSAHDAASSISEEFQNKLGSILRETYYEIPDVTPDHLERLLASLGSALDAQENSDDKLFQTDILKLTPNLRKFAMSLAKNPALADDLVQDTYLRAWRGRKHFQLGTNLGAWLFTIMRNLFYSRKRREKSEVADTDGSYAELMASRPEQLGRLDLLDAQNALRALPEVMRQALILVTIENLSYEEAAVVMRCKIGTVKSRVCRARERLAVELGFTGSEVGTDSLLPYHSRLAF